MTHSASSTLKKPLGILLLLFLSLLVKAQPEVFSAKNISRNALKINASVIDDFHEGYAIIRKGESFAVIDKNGNFLIPYDKYKFNQLRGYEIDQEKCGFYQGMCVVRDVDSEKYGYINNKGILVIPCTLNDAEPFKIDGFAWAKHKNAQGQDEQVYLDKQGNKYKIKDPILTNRNQLDAYRVTLAGAMEYYNKKGQLLFRSKGYYTNTFSEGLIAVDTTFELAGTKGGYKNLAGKLVIPYKLKLGHHYPFSDGLALYRPPSQDEFKYIYINKEGEQVIKLRSTEKFKNIYFENSAFRGGYAFGSSGNSQIVLNKAGEMRLFDDVLRERNPELMKKFTSFDVTDIKVQPDGYVWFRANLDYEVPIIFVTGGLGGGKKINKMDPRRMVGCGIADPGGNIIIPPIYQRVGTFDPISGLAKVFYTKEEEENPVKINGYASREGITMLLSN